MYLPPRYVPSAKIQRYRGTYTGTEVHVRDMYTFVKIGTSYVVPTYVPRYFLGDIIYL